MAPAAYPVLRRRAARGLSRRSPQDAAAGALIEYLAHRGETLLSDDQLAEVRRRRADPDQEIVSHIEARAFIRQLIS